jgi:hypothetical protein
VPLGRQGWRAAWLAPRRQVMWAGGCNCGHCTPEPGATYHGFAHSWVSSTMISLETSFFMDQYIHWGLHQGVTYLGNRSPAHASESDQVQRRAVGRLCFAHEPLQHSDNTVYPLPLQSHRNSVVSIKMSFTEPTLFMAVNAVHSPADSERRSCCCRPLGTT